MEQIIDLKSIKFVQLNNDEFAQFITGVSNLIQSATPEKLFISEKIFREFKEKLNELTEVGRQTRISKETQSIAELDKKRSELVVFLLSSFRVEQKNIITRRKDAATTLYTSCKNHLGIQLLPLRQKTHAINTLIKELNKEDNKKLIDILGVTDAITILTSYNHDLQKLLDGRAESQIANSSPSAKILREELTKLYKYITKCAFAMNITNKTDESTNFVNLINKLIEDTTIANHQRLAQVASSKK